MQITQKLEIIIKNYSKFKSLKKKLLLECEECPKNNNYVTNIIGTKLFTENGPYSEIVFNWVIKLLKDKFHNINSEPIKYDKSMWFAKYNEGDYTKVHSHEPYALFSWVYFVNCPKGSSPLVLSNTKIKAEEGKLVIFPAFIKHHVPINKCKNRITLVGNMLPSYE